MTTLLQRLGACSGEPSSYFWQNVWHLVAFRTKCSRETGCEDLQLLTEAGSPCDLSKGKNSQTHFPKSKVLNFVTLHGFEKNPSTLAVPVVFWATRWVGFLTFLDCSVEGRPRFPFCEALGFIVCLKSSYICIKLS